MKWKCFLTILAIVIALSSAVTVVNAHRTYMRSEIGEIVVKAWYGGGEPIRDADIKVYAIEGAEEELYKRGETDKNGKFVFSPKTGIEEYKAVVESAGHRGEITINLTKAAPDRGETEMPLYTRVIAGFGYLIGLAGAAMVYMGWKLKKKYGR